MSKEKPNDREKKFFSGFKQRATRLVKDRAALRDLLEQAQQKAGRVSEDESFKSKVVSYVRLVLRMLSNSVSGRYPDLPWQTLVMMVAGILYFVTPFDAIPDFIPVAGLVDDATILLWLGKSFQDDLERYKKWEGVN